VRRGGFWAKHMGSKQGTIGNTLGEHNGNLRNILGAGWESVGNKGKMKKISPPTPKKNLKEKKSMHFECMLNLGPFFCFCSNGPF